MGSTRLPGKVLERVQGIPLIQILINRLSLSKHIDELIIATSTNSQDDILEELANNKGFNIFRGSEKDVLERYYYAAKKFSANTIVRITGDCPLVDPDLVDETKLFILKCFFN